jgi:hypothetical protein
MSWFLGGLILLNAVWLSALTVFVILLAQKKSKQDMSGNLPAFGWSLVHFNPFSEVGGQHSFVITLLDPHKNGVILTGLHGRGLTRFYTKLISNGLSDQPLSAEEIRGLKEALLKLR